MGNFTPCWQSVKCCNHFGELVSLRNIEWKPIMWSSNSAPRCKSNRKVCLWTRKTGTELSRAGRVTVPPNWNDYMNEPQPHMTRGWTDLYSKSGNITLWCDKSRQRCSLGRGGGWVLGVGCEGQCGTGNHSAVWRGQRPHRGRSLEMDSLSYSSIPCTFLFLCVDHSKKNFRKEKAISKFTGMRCKETPGRGWFGKERVWDWCKWLKFYFNPRSTDWNRSSCAASRPKSGKSCPKEKLL